ncbi:hypothetical protein SSX86_030799 [Deinandra increscens subsp. villosa]|uniref:Transposase n=1 Tax=Deinandra increscens subsp. villosa TaxID=3103831 RepID=A0AAP0C596_9ASTR
MNDKTAKEMRWHDIGRTKDGNLRHPADGGAWKAFDVRYRDFSSDPRSVCMKQESFILSMIIPGGKGPGNDIDVYLRPLIEELKLLWDGVDSYDAFSKKRFKLQASLLWTVSDFPAYANLSGWSTKGRVACPVCGKSTHSEWLTHGKKFCYIGHRRWLEPNHISRSQMDRFDGTIEEGGPPSVLTGSEILKQTSGTNFIYGKSTKSCKKRTIDDVDSSMHSSLHAMEDTCDGSSAFNDTHDFIEENIDAEQQFWKKRSIFFDLPYWEHNLLRHNLDVMHIEKNVCDNILGTLLNIDGKSKDNENSRKDLMKKGIRHELHLIEQPNKKLYLPPACYTMSNVEKRNFLQVLKDLKVPDGYASNISRGVSLKDRRILNLKSHDAHILMQDILPIALRVSMTSRAQSRVVKALYDFCSFFKGLCAKVLDLSELEELECQIVLTLCELEQLFPPSFFTIMVHLTIHLISEAKLGGPVHYRWMYPVERYLMRLKSYVRNKAQPEGSIAEGYIKDECITFCSRYFEGVETSFNRPPRNNENTYRLDMYMLNSGGRKLGKVEDVELDSKSLAQAHRYVLLNHPKIQPLRGRFMDEMQALRNERMDKKIMEKLLVEEFSCWLHQKAPLLKKNKSDEEVLSLVVGPSTHVKMCKGFITNGFRFLTKRREEFRKTQNSGVFVQAVGGNYYGKLTEIIELEYSCNYKVVLFRCGWVDIRPSRGLKKDKYGFPLVNFSKPLAHTGEALKDDPFIISSQARQVFYIEDVKDVGWSHVIMTKPRDTYDMGSNISTNDEDEVYTQCIPSDLPVFDDVSVPPRLRRIDMEIDDE